MNIKANEVNKMADKASVVNKMADKERASKMCSCCHCCCCYCCLLPQSGNFWKHPRVCVYSL